MRADTPPNSLHRNVSPPPRRAAKKRKHEESPIVEQTNSILPAPAAVEAGQVPVKDHLSYFSHQLSRFNRNAPSLDSQNKAIPSSLSIEAYRNLYLRNAGSKAGHHFVIHQHDHPRAGTHYDLRLQINEDSSCSWAIPYGPPGNPNERRHGRRQGIETRVHSLWNHLIEAASHKTGSMLIWDTGEYEVLPYKEIRSRMTDDELSGKDDDDSHDAKQDLGKQTESEKLSVAFRRGKIRLRLKGAKLPPGYTMSIALSSDAKVKISGRPPEIPVPSKTKKRAKRVRTAPATTDEDEDQDPPQRPGPVDIDTDAEADEAEYKAVRANNAYPGARNTVGSMHQRWWFISIDKARCGFIREKVDGRVWWAAKDSLASRNYPFFVMGRDAETSVVTGRKAADVLRDEGVENYRFRDGWQPILN